jgi:hypothetical protein
MSEEKTPDLTTLTGNDLALAWSACCHAIAWCKQQGGSKYWRTERAKYTALAHKLSTISQTVYPDEPDAPLDLGGEPIMRLDRRVVGKIQADSRRRARQR